MMKPRNMRVPAMALCSLILAQPAWAQSTPPSSGSVDATATIEDAQLVLQITSSGTLDFQRVTRPNGVVNGAQCRYTLAPDTDFEARIAVSEIRNGQVFDAAPPTASGCASLAPGSIFNVPGFSVRCSPASPVTIRAEWTSGDTPGATLTGVSQGVFQVIVDGQGNRFPINLVNNSSVNCPESANPENQFFVVGVGGALTLDANVITTANARVGTVTLNASY